MKSGIPLFCVLMLFYFQGPSQISKEYYERFLLSPSLKSNQVKAFADSIYSEGKEAIPMLIDFMPSFDRVHINLVKPVISYIPNYYIQENYVGMRAAYFIEWLLWNKNPHIYNYDSYYKSLGINEDPMMITKITSEYYINKYNFLLNLKNDRFYYEDMLNVQTIYKNWWEKNKHLSFKELQELFNNEPILRYTQYVWK